MVRIIASALVLSLLAILPARAQTALHHELQVTIHPDNGTLEARDRITLPADLNPEFLLHQNLRPSVEGQGRLQDLGAAEPGRSLHRYRLVLPAGGHQVILKYVGSIGAGLKHTIEDVGRGRTFSSGHLGDDGVYLSDASGWYPQFGDTAVSFTLDVTLPQHWSAVSQGNYSEPEASPGTHRVAWREDHPQQAIYLVAGRYTLYRRPAGSVEAMVFLREPDPALAKRYLDATAHYLTLYSRLLGPYPYAKFALVENFWESGYGFPSFTLLGPRVLRLPFILNSSYPHEILHNWWGNGVYVDYRGGNWSEGLTAYLADHLLKEEAGHGAAYRRDALQKYAEYAKGHAEISLREFTARHGQASQAVGYGKGAMVFHMLRRRLGDGTFLNGLRRFYRDFQFKQASFSDLQHSFEDAAGHDLNDFFEQWVERRGAPQLELGPVELVKDEHGYRLRTEIRQTQAGPLYKLLVPVAVQQAGQMDAEEAIVAMNGPSAAVDLDLLERPLRLVVDPAFDLFRRLDPGEVPTSLDRLFSAPHLLLVLPAAAPAERHQAYRALAESWSQGNDRVEYHWDNELEQLPEDRAVWVMGWDNRFNEAFAAELSTVTATLDTQQASLNGDPLPRDKYAVVLTAPASDGRHPLAWLGSDSPQALAGLTRKLPHYGKYSYLAFSGERPDIQIKGQWEVTSSPLVITLQPGTLPPLGLSYRPALTQRLE